MSRVTSRRADMSPIYDGLRIALMPDVNALVTGRSFLEGPRWHDGALYVSDMHGDAVLRVSEDGEVSTVVELEQPSGLGWLPDGSMLIVSMTRRQVMRFDGSDLAVHADVSAFSSHEINDMCVDRHGHAFVGQFGFDYFAGGKPAAAALLRVDPDGSACAVRRSAIRQRNGDHRRRLHTAGGRELRAMHHSF